MKAQRTRWAGGFFFLFFWASVTGCASLVGHDEDAVQQVKSIRLEKAMTAPQALPEETRQALWADGQIKGSPGHWTQGGRGIGRDRLIELADAWQVPASGEALRESQKLQRDPPYYWVNRTIGLIAGYFLYVASKDAWARQQNNIGSYLTYGYLEYLVLAGLPAAGFAGGEYVSRLIEGSARLKRGERSLLLEKQGVDTLNAALRQRLSVPKSPLK